MTVLTSAGLSDLLISKYLFLDSDFLNDVYHDSQFLELFTDLVYGKAYPIIDPLVEFEFLRSIYFPDEITKRLAFIQGELFSPAINHSEIFMKIQENAMILWLKSK